MNKFRSIVLGCLLFSLTATISFGQENLAKLFIKAEMTEINGQPVPDIELNESVKDMKKKPGKFILVDKESDADFLIIVLERVSVPMSGRPAAKSIFGALYVREADGWKPAAKLKSGVSDLFWGIAAEKLIKNAEKWVKTNAGKSL